MNLEVKVGEGIYLKGAYTVVQTCSDARNMFFCRSCSDGTNDHGCAWSCLSSGPEDRHDGQSYCDICHLTTSVHIAISAATPAVGAVRK